MREGCFCGRRDDIRANLLSDIQRGFGAMIILSDSRTHSFGGCATIATVRKLVQLW